MLDFLKSAHAQAGHILQPKNIFVYWAVKHTSGNPPAMSELKKSECVVKSYQV